jgi:hypothetical protein
MKKGKDTLSFLKTQNDEGRGYQESNPTIMPIYHDIGKGADEPKKKKKGQRSFLKEEKRPLESSDGI